LDFENEAKDLNNLETLFDMQKTNYPALKQCKSELIALKQMWDLIALIDGQFDQWKKTLWAQIDTGNLETLIKEMQTKQCNPQAPQNKEIKGFKAFQSLNERVKNMNAILPLISELHSPYMMDRHWKKLMKMTMKEIKFADPQFCFADLIKLDLFKIAEDVSELVESAQKEQNLEKKLTKIEKTWEDQNFTFEGKDDTYILNITDLGDITEFVDTQSMELMGMQASKDVEIFKERVDKWREILKTVEAVITSWIKV